MSRKKSAPKKLNVVDPKYKSVIIPKLINSLMYDGKKTIAEKIVYDAINKIKSKSKDEPITVFNQAISNIKPTVEVRSRRVGGATYQVPVEVKAKRSQALAIRWLVDSARKRKEIFAVGVAYDKQEVQTVPKEKSDFQLDAILTEKRVILREG